MSVFIKQQPSEGKLEFPTDKYDPNRAFRLRHDLEDHPLLQLPSLVALAKRIKPPADVRWFRGRTSAGANFRQLVETHGDGQSLEMTLDHIDEPGSWVGFHYIENDPIYKTLIDTCLDSVAPEVESLDPGMFQRIGFIFVSAPGTVTPYHMDPDNGLLLQARGSKSIHIWDPDDREVVSERSIEEYLANLPVNERRYKEEYETRGHTFEITTGDGVYIPWMAPHWVRVGDADYSVSFSVSFRTRETERRRILHQANHMLRRRGLHPAPIGKSALGDAMKIWSYRTIERAKRAIRR